MNYHYNPPTMGYHDRTTQPGYQATSDVPLPGILTDVLDGGADSVRNPDALGEGDYGDVKIDESNRTVLDSGVYVMKRLEITGAGQLTLPQGKQATIYVTEHLSATGQDALVNDTKLPPNLKIFYTGGDPIVLSGGSQSYFTLVAPKAQVQMIGPDAAHPTTFHGALVGKSVDVENTNFHYDLATEGVGTGTDGSTLSLLSRQRL